MERSFAENRSNGHAFTKADQKLVTVYLDNSVYAKGKMVAPTHSDRHGVVEEHLSFLLNEGWRVKQLTALGGGAGNIGVRGWIVAILER
jgi:hypothetical protein